MIHRVEMMLANSCDKLPTHLKKWDKYIED